MTAGFLRVVGEASGGLLPVALAWTAAYVLALAVRKRSRAVAGCLFVAATFGLLSCAADLAGPVVWLWNKGNVGPGVPLARASGLAYALARLLQALAIGTVALGLSIGAWTRPSQAPPGPDAPPTTSR